MAKLATQVRVTGNRSSDEGRMVLDAIAKYNKKVKDRGRRREKDTS